MTAALVLTSVLSLVGALVCVVVAQSIWAFFAFLLGTLSLLTLLAAIIRSSRA